MAKKRCRLCTIANGVVLTCDRCERRYYRNMARVFENEMPETAAQFRAYAAKEETRR